MKVYISATLRGFFGRNERIEIEGETIRTLLAGLTDEYPDAKEALYDETGELRDFIQIYVNEENFTDKEKWDNSLHADDEVLLLPAIAGGATVVGYFW